MTTPRCEACGLPAHRYQRDTANVPSAVEQIMFVELCRVLGINRKDADV